jgi:4-alpha-glucanotransferase
MARASILPPTPTTRSAGVLLHPTSLPGRYGIGDLGDELIAFLDWAKSAGLRIWQVLPLNVPGYGNSPYGCLSSYAGNPLLISPQRLLHASLLPADAVEDVPTFNDDHVEFGRVAELKMSLLRRSFAHFNEQATDAQREALAAFERDNAWLPDWALYAALKERNGGKQWSAWPAELASREKAALAAARTELADEIRFHKYVQWLFFTQWAAVREAAIARGIRIMGDVPIYVAADSADVWANRQLFQLNEDGEPSVVAGVPPDYFSVTGQRWGNPLYRWDLLRETKYRWWVSRFRAALRFADIVRVDHFRGFAAYWEIPANEPTAIHGRWMPGPGRALFDAVRSALGDLPLVAEDLGFITPEVHDLRHAVGLPGMKILQFGFAQIDSPHLPHRYDAETVVYTGTHDNDTTRGWWDSLPEDEREWTGFDPSQPAWSLLEIAWSSRAALAIAPLQDVLGLGSESRMNLPGTDEGNWQWRYQPEELTPQLAKRLRAVTESSGRPSASASF